MKFIKNPKPWEARILKCKGRRRTVQLQNREKICLSELLRGQMMPSPQWGRGGRSLLSQSLWETTSQTSHLIPFDSVKMVAHGIGPHFSGRQTWGWRGWLSSDHARRLPGPHCSHTVESRAQQFFWSKIHPLCLCSKFSAGLNIVSDPPHLTYFCLTWYSIYLVRNRL